MPIGISRRPSGQMAYERFLYSERPKSSVGNRAFTPCNLQDQARSILAALAMHLIRNVLLLGLTGLVAVEAILLVRHVAMRLVDPVCTLWRLRHVIDSRPYKTTSRTLSSTCRSAGLIFGSSASAKSASKSRNKLSPATKLFGYGSPVDFDLPKRTWHCGQIEVTAAGESLSFLASGISLASLACSGGASPWQTKQSSEGTANACVSGSTAVAWQPALGGEDVGVPRGLVDLVELCPSSARQAGAGREQIELAVRGRSLEKPVLARVPQNQLHLVGELPGRGIALRAASAGLSASASRMVRLCLFAPRSCRPRCDGRTGIRRFP